MQERLLLNIRLNWSWVLLNNSWIEVVLAMNVADILSCGGAMSHRLVSTLLGIHSTKPAGFFSRRLYISFSTSRALTLPRKMAATVRYLPCRGSMAAMMFLGVVALGDEFRRFERLVGFGARCDQGGEAGGEEVSRGKGTRLTPILRKSELSWPGNRSVVEQPDIGIRDDRVEVGVGGVLGAECALANVVQRFVVETEGHVGVFDELVERQRGVVCSTTVSDTLGKAERTRLLAFDRGTLRAAGEQVVPRPEPVPPPSE